MKWATKIQPLRSALVLTALMAAGCAAQGASQSELDALLSDKQALQQQLASMTPTIVVQAGQIGPPSPRAQQAEWDTPESVRGRVRLLVTYDSSGHL